MGEHKIYSTIAAGNILGINHKTIGSWIDRGLLQPAKFEQIRNKRLAARFDEINLIEIYMIFLLAKFGFNLKAAAGFIKPIRADMKSKKIDFMQEAARGHVLRLIIDFSAIRQEIRQRVEVYHVRT